ncbi:MAG: acyltransferase [Ferruginibacter sp.]
MEEKKNTLGLIQALRGAASLLVVLYHTSSNAISNFGQEFCSNIFFFGSSGVDIFFVLSGFIITYTSSKGLEDPGKLGGFLYKRIVRIFPPYWIIITFFLLMQILLPAFYRTHFNLSFANTAAAYFLFPGHTMVNGVSWSLSYELFFYVLFALAFIIPRKKWAFYLCMIYTIVIIVMFTSRYSHEYASSWTKLIFCPMNVEFFLGVFAAILIPKISKVVSVPFIITGLLLFLAAAIFIDIQKIELHPDFYLRVLLFGPASFFIITGLVKLELTQKLNIHNLLLKLGEASYSLYLLHLPLVVAFVKILVKFNFKNIVVLHGLLILVIVFICYISILFYKFVEKPLTRKLTSFNKGKVIPAPVVKIQEEGRSTELFKNNIQ